VRTAGKANVDGGDDRVRLIEVLSREGGFTDSRPLTDVRVIRSRPGAGRFDHDYRDDLHVRCMNGSSGAFKA
jgi:hypothetical protein